MEFNATFLVSLLSFVVFVFIMNAILYKPISNIIKERSDYIDKNTKEADDKNTEKQALIDKKNDKIATTQKQSKKMVQENTDKIKSESEQKVKENSDRIKSETEEKKNILYSEKDSVQKEVEPEVLNIANQITSKILGEGGTN